MAFRKLSDVLGSKNKVDFKFVDFIQDEAQTDGSELVRFVLANPIPVVMGRRITDRVSGETATLQANDVEMVSMGKEAYDELKALQELWTKEETDKVPLAERKGEPVIDWTGDTSGTFTSKILKFDVSGNLDVWVVKTSLAQFGRNQRNERNAKQKSAIMDKINANKTKSAPEFKDVNVNTTKPAPETVGK